MREADTLLSAAAVEGEEQDRIKFEFQILNKHNVSFMKRCVRACERARVC